MNSIALGMINLQPCGKVNQILNCNAVKFKVIQLSFPFQSA